MTIRISVITPSFNHAEFIEETLRSVLDQNYPHLEYIVIDGGSTDGTAEILDRYRDQISDVVIEPDNGQTDALIKGFSRASGDILAWLNSDDVFEPNTLWEVARHFESHPEDRFIYGDAWWMDRDGIALALKREIPFNRFLWLYDYNYIAQPSAFWRRSLYEEVGGLDARFELAMDGDLFDRFATVTMPRHVPQTWSRFRYYPEQKNRSLRDKSDAEDALIRARHGIRTSGAHWHAMRVIAKGVRIARKAGTGCYRGYFLNRKLHNVHQVDG